MASANPDSAPFGSPAAWIAAAIVAGCAFAYAGWSAWLGRFLQLALACAIAHAGLVLATAYLSRRDIRFQVALALVASALGAAIATAALRWSNAAMKFPNADLAFDLGLAALLAATLLVTAILQRDALSRATQERQLAELRLSALQAQVEPHFLYNTLANVQQLVRSDAAAADRMLESLIRYLKTSIPDVRSGRSTLGQELSRTEAYLSIMSIRMGERLRYEIAVPTALNDVSVPPLSVMTLVENAVKHGLERRAAGGRVVIAGESRGGQLVLRVTDDGLGFGAEMGTGTGLTNLRERLASLHGDRAHVELSHAEPAGVEAQLVVPLG
ncbi:hypothetical protein DSM104443_00536 [Usitatibacter rugosus]|uniref:Uncharacterized protein n=1 Tax=Usitatibacter rugosus TaxID=2732067 RepID=A0A6M4GQT4_9PROT|nr:histidine kinase [Usitatibacter rugosus]QJR09492.1 hypothetical protein DSM104443_00536 [Usitatibacter rugosus]